MIHKDHVALLAPAIPKNSGGVWADLGSGDGAFTLALRDLVGGKAEIYSVDKDDNRLRQQQEIMKVTFPGTVIQYIHQDFTDPLSLPPLNGIIMANSLHFIEDKVPLLKQLRSYLKPQGKLIIIEYNADEGNIWVPYPTSDKTLSQLLQDAKFVNPHLLSTVRSDFLREIYSAVAYVS